MNRHAILRYALTVVLAIALVAPAQAASEQVRELSNGYALFHQTTQKLNRLPKLLYVKFESDAVDKLATRLGEDASEALAAIEEYAETHPGIELSEAGLSRIDRERRARTRNALVKDLVTSSGNDFERAFLLAMLNLLNQLRHTTAALSEVPQDEAGVNLASEWHDRFQADYEAVRQLLRSDYFRAELGS